LELCGVLPPQLLTKTTGAKHRIAVTRSLRPPRAKRGGAWEAEAVPPRVGVAAVCPSEAVPRVAWDKYSGATSAKFHLCIAIVSAIRFRMDFLTTLCCVIRVFATTTLNSASADYVTHVTYASQLVRLVI